MDQKLTDDPMLTVTTALEFGVDKINTLTEATARLDAQLLLCEALQKPRSFLFTWPEKCLTSAEIDRYEQLVARRVSGEPIAYILGEREFWSLPLTVSPTTLIPRPDTEVLVELSLDKLTKIQQLHPQSLMNVLDLGTGTGAIALALASELPHAKVYGVDLILEAKELAEYNAKKLDINNVTFMQGSWFEPIHQAIKFDCIVSNPPYIDKTDPHLQQGDVRFEPLSALVSDDEGLADLKFIVNEASAYLKQGAWLLIEHGYNQGQSAREIFAQHGYVNIETKQDYSAQDRVTLGQWVGSVNLS